MRLCDRVAVSRAQPQQYHRLDLQQRFLSNQTRQPTTLHVQTLLSPQRLAVPSRQYVFSVHALRRRILQKVPEGVAPRLGVHPRHQ